MQLCTGVTYLHPDLFLRGLKHGARLEDILEAPEIQDVHV